MSHETRKSGGCGFVTVAPGTGELALTAPHTSRPTSHLPQVFPSLCALGRAEASQGSCPTCLWPKQFLFSFGSFLRSFSCIRPKHLTAGSLRVQLRDPPAQILANTLLHLLFQLSVYALHTHRHPSLHFPSFLRSMSHFIISHATSRKEL